MSGVLCATIGTFKAAASGSGITFVGVNSGNSAAASVSTQTRTIPSTAQAGDVAFFLAAANTSSTNTISSGPSGFTLITNNSTGSGKQILYYKVLGSGDPGTNVTLTMSLASLMASAIVVYRGVNSTTFDATTATGTGTATATFTFPTVTTVTNNAWVLHMVAARNSVRSAGSSFAPPTSPTHTERVDTSTTGTNSFNAQLEISDYTLATAGATGSQSGTSSTAGGYTTWTIALRPA